MLMRLVSLGKAQKAPVSKKCSGRAAVGRSIEGTSGPRGGGVWSGRAEDLCGDMEGLEAGR